MVAGVLDREGGQFMVMAAGLIILATAGLQFAYGITRGYKERIDMAHFSPRTKSAIHYLAWAGYLARGIIIGITGFFMVKAGIVKAAQHVVNTDKAFDFIGDNIGGVAFILVATGTICYSLFMFFLGVSYDADEG